MIEQGQKGGVCRHKSQITKKVKKAHSITQDTNIKATHLLMQMEQLVNSDTAHKSVPAVAGGCLRHIIKVYKLANLSINDMCVKDAKQGN